MCQIEPGELWSASSENWAPLTDPHFEKSGYVPCAISSICQHMNEQFYRCAVLSLKILFSVFLEQSSFWSYKVKIWVETVKLFGWTKQFCDLQLPQSCCVSLIMVTITRHVFINVFQTEHISVVKFNMGYEKNMSFLAIPKSPKLRKEVEKIGLGSFN